MEPKQVSTQAPLWATTGIAHLALILAAAAAAGFLYSRGDLSSPRDWGIAIQALLVLLFAAQFIIARRAPGVFAKGMAYALSTAGALCVFLGSFAKGETLATIIAILCALFFGAGITLFVLQIRKVRRSQQ